MSKRGQEMDLPPIPNELLVEIFLRLPNPADLVRAAAACVSFRRIVADRSFLRLYRKLHAPPLLGFLDRRKVFHPAIAPHPSASAAGAVALAADFSFAFLPAPTRNWVVRDIRDGRVLLDRRPQHDIDNRNSVVFQEMVVCDPLHQRYLLLPPIPDNLACTVEDPLLIQWYRHCETFLGPAESETSAAQETSSFSVIWMAQCRTKLVAFVFYSSTGKWRAISSNSWSDLLGGLLSSTLGTLFFSRQYLYGCFYWMIDCGEKDKLLTLDTKTMEFSIAERPPEAKGYCSLAMAEAVVGRPRMFVIADDTSDLSDYTIGQHNNGGSSSQWQKMKTVSLGYGSFLVCNRDKYLLLYQQQSSKLEAGCFMLDMETFQLKKVCVLGSNIHNLRAYSNFPPSLLSSPTI